MGSKEAKNEEQTHKASIPLIQDAEEILRSLEAYLDELDSTPLPKDVHKRAAKPVKTGKPSFIRSMRRAICTMTEASGTPLDFEKVFSAGLESIAKASIGPGRYLSFGYPMLMQEIQATSKELLVVSDKLTDALKPSDDHQKILSVKSAYDKYILSQKEMESLTSALDDAKKHLRIDKKNLKQIGADILSATNQMDGEEISGVKGSVESAESELATLDSRISGLISPLKRGLRKYSKVSLDESKSIDLLLADPVPACISLGAHGVWRVLTKFVSALEMGSVKLKDNDKTVNKAKQAITELTEDLFQRYDKAALQVSESRRRLEGFTVFNEIKSLKEKDIALRITVDSDQAEISRIEGHMGTLDKMIKNLQKHLGELMANAGYVLLT